MVKRRGLPRSSGCVPQAEVFPKQVSSVQLAFSPQNVQAGMKGLLSRGYDAEIPNAQACRKDRETVKHTHTHTHTPTTFEEFYFLLWITGKGLETEEVLMI